MAMIGARRKGSETNWKGIYTPDILAIGEGPTSFTDYFNQQQRWAYGIWEIIQRFSRNSLKTMSASQRLTFIMLQFFYPSLAISWVVSSMVSVGFSFIHPEYNGLGFAFTLAWLISLASCLGIFFWSRRFNLSSHERNDWGVAGIILTLMTLPVYTNAAWQAIRKVPLTYAVTAKGNMASPDSIRTFYPHIWWIAVSALAALLIYAGTRTYMSSAFFWTVEHAVVCLLPMLVFAYFKTHRSIREMVSTARYRTKES
jgi:cellulose synthase/poly-beta-1,6-N-acetylglucosamine synthase-like glycosyltransferase